MAREWFLSVAAALAGALDRADFEAASRCIAPACVYEKPDGVLEGVDAIIASYRRSHERALATLDGIVYRSRIEALAPGVVRLFYADHIEVAGRQHVYRCEQDVSIGRSRLVERIVHRERSSSEEASLET